MSKSIAIGLTLAVSLGCSTQTAQAQVRERDVTITGPRGRTVERKLESVRTPGGLSREMTIQRPGGTYQRELNVIRPPAHVGGGVRGFGYPPVRDHVFIERDVIVPPPRPFVPGFSVGPSFNLSLGLPLMPPPPPPVYFQPAPVYVPSPTVVYTPPVRYLPGQPLMMAPPATVVVDPVADAIGRLSSFHANSRRDGAYILGRLGDARAAGPLIDRLKNDSSKDVRIAAATALGQIGEPSTAIILERAITYDKKQEVRDAAALALSRMPKVVEESAPSVAAASSRIVTSRPSPREDHHFSRSSGREPLPQAAENVPPPPVPSEPK